MVYNSSIDAVKELIFAAENGGYVSWISDKDSRLINGLDYCLVEITCRSGTQYAVQTYGDEALKLFWEVMTLIRIKHSLRVPNTKHTNDLPHKI